MEQNLDSWVMNVVPVSGPNTLPVIYDRGLIGVLHDWYFRKLFLVSISYMCMDTIAFIHKMDRVADQIA